MKISKIIILFFIYTVFLANCSAKNEEGVSADQYAALVNENICNVTAVTAGYIKSFLECPLNEIRTLSILMSNIDIVALPGERRYFVNYMLKSLAAANPDYVGVWAVFEPNALDGQDAQNINMPGSDHTGRYVSYWANDYGRITVTALTDYADSDYYLTSLRSGKEAVIEPYFKDIGGQKVLITNVTVPIMKDGRVIGVAGIDIDLRTIQDVISVIKPLETGYAELYSPGGMVVASVDESKLGRNVQDVSRELYGNHLNALMRSINNGVPFIETADSKEHNAKMIIAVYPFFIGNFENAWSAVSIAPAITQ